MIKPEVEVVRFNTEDVIATSGGVRLSGFGNTQDTNTFKVGNQTFTNMDESSAVPSELITALQGAGGKGDNATRIMFWTNNDGTAISLDGLWRYDNINWGSFNGTYTWKDYAWYRQ